MLLNVMIQMLIQATYKGGAAEFDRHFCTFMAGDNTFVIAKLGDKDLPEEFLSKLKEMASGMNFEVAYCLESNFSGLGNEEAAEYFNERLNEHASKFAGRIMVQANKAMIDIIAPGIEEKSDEGQTLVDTLAYEDVMPNIRIQFEDSTFYKLSTPESYKEAEKTLNTVQNRLAADPSTKPKRDIVISEDDVLNLKIALGSAETIEDFLGMV